MNIITNGKRKTANSRLIHYNSPSTLEVYFNNNSVDNIPYLKEVINLADLKLPTGKIIISSSGGGVTGSLESARLALARFLVQFDLNNKLGLVLYNPKILRSDPRYTWKKLPESYKSRTKRQKSYR